MYTLSLKVLPINVEKHLSVVVVVALLVIVAVVDIFAVVVAGVVCLQTMKPARPSSHCCRCRRWQRRITVHVAGFVMHIRIRVRAIVFVRVRSC